MTLFLVVSLLSFSVWAFGGRYFPNEPSMYAACAVVFLGLGGLSLLPTSGFNRKQSFHFCLSFTVGFLVYAFVWSVAWFALPNTMGEILGSSLGLTGLAAVLIRWNRWKLSLLIATSILFLFHTIGYYFGGFAYQSLQGRGPVPLELNVSPENIRLLARLMWGVGYGIGLGLGLTITIYLSHQSSESPSTHI